MSSSTPTKRGVSRPKRYLVALLTSVQAPPQKRGVATSSHQQHGYAIVQAPSQKRVSLPSMTSLTHCVKFKRPHKKGVSLPNPQITRYRWKFKHPYQKEGIATLKRRPQNILEFKYPHKKRVSLLLSPVSSLRSQFKRPTKRGVSTNHGHLIFQRCVQAPPPFTRSLIRSWQFQHPYKKGVAISPGVV